MRRAPIFIGSLAFMALTACGGRGYDGGGAAPPGATGDGDITATINGTPWRSSRASDRATMESDRFLAITSAGGNYLLVMGLKNVNGPGIFPLNLAKGSGSSAIISNSGGGWGTAFSGRSGTVNITILTATRVAGTFFFDAVPGAGSATGTMQVGNGTFDLTL